MSKLLESITKTRIAVVSLIITSLWLFYIEDIAGIFQTIHNVDPLSMIDALYPYFWILLISLALLCVVCLCLDINSKGLHSLLLGEISLMLFYTPFVLSGYSWNPDALWHGGIATYIPQILQGAKISLGSYAQTYPFSYVLTYCMEKVTGLNVFAYGTYVYPFVSILLTTLLGYIFLSRLFTAKIGFLSMLFALSSMHFFEQHISPFSLGTIFVLGALVMLTIDGRAAKGLLLLLIFVCVVTHPISPVSLGIFLVPIVLLMMLKDRLGFSGSIRGIRLKVSVKTVLFLVILWLSWTFYVSFYVYPSIGYTISRIVSLRFLSQIEHVSRFTSSGGFYYNNISLLEEGVYATIAAFALITILLTLVKLVLHRKRNVTDFLGFLFSLLTLLFAAFGYALFLSTGEQTLLGRGLVFFVITGGVCMALLLLDPSSNLKRAKFYRAKTLLTTLLIMLFFVSFPIVSYSREAYNTFTPSFGEGMSFLSTHANLSNLSVSLSSYQQLAAYVNLSNGLNLAGYPPPSNETPNFVVLTINSFFDNALRYALNFTNNNYTVLQQHLNANTSYDEIYSNPAFHVYASNGN